MKIIIFLFLLISTFSFSQDYRLLPDSCTYCFYLKSFQGTGLWENAHYGLNPNSDTLIQGTNYMKLFDPYTSSYARPFAIRQDGNQMKGLVNDSISEFLIMDFDTPVGDTIINLYSEGYFYNAVVMVKDSVLVNGGVYHHFVQLEGFEYFENGQWNAHIWPLTWNERGLCSMNPTPLNLGGVFFNVPTEFYSISVSYGYPQFCTTDPKYNAPLDVYCENCNPQINSIETIINTIARISPNPAKEIVQIDLLIEFANNSEISLLDSKGNVILTQITQNSENKINLSDISPGIYMVHIITENGQNSAQKLIIL